MSELVKCFGTGLAVVSAGIASLFLLLCVAAAFHEDAPKPLRIIGGSILVIAISLVIGYAVRHG